MITWLRFGVWLPIFSDDWLLFESTETEPLAPALPVVGSFGFLVPFGADFFDELAEFVDSLVED